MQEADMQSLLPNSNNTNTVETAMAHPNRPAVELNALRSDCLHLRAELVTAMHDSARLQSSLDVRVAEHDRLLCELKCSGQIREQQQDDLNTVHRKLQQQRKQHLDLTAKLEQPQPTGSEPHQEQRQEQQQFRILQQQQEIDRLRKQALLMEEGEAERQGIADAHATAQEELSFLRMNAAMQRAETAFAISQRERMEATLQQLQQQLQNSEASRSALSDQLSVSRAERTADSQAATISAASENLSHNLQSAAAMASVPLPDREHVQPSLHEQHQSSQQPAAVLEPGQPTNEARSRQQGDIEGVAADCPCRRSSPANNAAPDRKQVLKLKAQLAALVAASQAHVAAQEADGLRHRAALADLHRRCVDAEAPQLALRQQCQAATATVEKLIAENVELTEQVNYLRKAVTVGHQATIHHSEPMQLAGGLRVTQSQLQLLALAEEVDRLSNQLAEERFKNSQLHLLPDRALVCPSANGGLTTRKVADASAVESDKPVADLSPPIAQHCLRPTDNDIAGSTSLATAVQGTTLQQALQDQKPSECAVSNSNHAEIPQTVHTDRSKHRGFWAYVTGAS